MKSQDPRKSLFLGCLMTSMVIHGGFLYLFFNTPLFLQQQSGSFCLKTSREAEFLVADSNEKLIEKVNQALEESFSQVLAAGQEAKNKEQPAIAQNESKKEKIFLASECSNEDELSLDYLDPAEKNTDFCGFAPEPLQSLEEDPFGGYHLESYESHDLIDELSTMGVKSKQPLVDDFSMSQQSTTTPDTAANSSQEVQNNLPEFLKQNYDSDAVIEEDLRHSEISKDRIPSLQQPSFVHTEPVEHLREAWTNKSIIEQKMHAIDYYGFTDIANSVLWDDEIKVDVSYAPDPEGKKYIFSLTVHPDFDVNAEPLQQNFYFLIDRSGSIKKSSFNAHKRAVQRALSALQDGDKFNIFIFDKEISRLSEKNLFFSTKNIRLAEEFLERENYKPFFSSNDLYESLEHLFPPNLSNEEINSAILISDGNTLLSTAKQKKALLKWTQKYKGKINLYTAASGQGNNLVLLDLLSYTASGKLLYSDTNASFPRKLVKLVQDLHHPILNEVTVDAVAQDPDNTLALYPAAKVLLPPLYLKRPFTIVGTIEDLGDFTLYIQGKNRGGWLNVKKTISFKDSVKGGRSLEKTWAYTRANLCYDQFLKEGKNTHLKEAKQILAPYKAIICQE